MICPICESSNHEKVAEKYSYDIHKCEACSLIFICPLPSEQELTEFYENYHKSKQYKDKIESKIKRAKKRIRSVTKDSTKSFLDIGCNLGFATEAARSLGHKAMGIDVDSDAIRQAKRRFPGANFRYMPIEELADMNEKFDVLYCSEVIEHLTDPVGFLRASKAVMNEGAVFFLTTPDIEHYSLSKNISKLVEWTTFRPPEHLLYFNKESLRKTFERAGFERVKFRFNFKPTLKVIARI